MDKILHDLKDSKLWDIIFLIVGNAGFCPSTVGLLSQSNDGPIRSTEHT